MGRLRAALILTAFAPTALVATAQPAGDRVVETMLRDWEQARQRHKQVRYTIVGSVEYKKRPGDGRRMPGIPADTERPYRATVAIDFERRASRLDIREDVQSETGFVTQTYRRTYDGESFRTWMPRAENRLSPDQYEVTVAKGAFPSDLTVEQYLWPPFLAHGIVDTADHAIMQHKLPFAHEADQFEVRGTVTHDGRPCRILRGSPVNSPLAAAKEYWIDTGRNSLLTRYTGFSGKEPVVRLDVRYRQAAGEWTPESWVLAYLPNGKLQELIKLKVESYEPEPNLPTDYFTVPIEPGMIVLTHDYPARGTGLDPTKPATTTSRVEPGGGMKELNATGYTTFDGVRLPLERASRVWWWATGGSVAVVAAVVLWRASRRRSGPGPTAVPGASSEPVAP